MTFFEKFLFKFPISHKRFQMGQKTFLSIVQAVTEILKKSHFSFQMGNCPIPVAKYSGHCLLYTMYKRLHYLNQHLGTKKSSIKLGICFLM